MYTSCKPSNPAKYALIHSIMLVLLLMVSPQRILASEETPNKAGAIVLVLEDSDSDNDLATPPNGDILFLLNSKCELVRKLYGLMITGNGFISASGDGRFFVVYENTPNKLTMYETTKNRVIWSLYMDFTSAVFVNDMIYAVNAYNVYAIDNTGTIVKHARLGGIDIAVDTKHDCLWIVGLDVKKCNLDLQLQFKTKLTLGVIETGAFSVDFNPIGSVWIAERNVKEEYGSKNRLVKRSLYGDILKTVGLDFSPICLRIDGYDGSLDELNELTKTDTEAFTRKYDSEGNLIFEIREGGHSIELDQSDRSAWIAGKKNIWHYSAKGQKLGSYAGSSDGQKWLAVIPGKN